MAMGVKPGQTLGQYRILEQIGKRGMATVYRASQPSLSRQVAIKVLPEFFAEDASLLTRFRQEAIAIAALRHPNILTVFDSGEAEGAPYMVTELVEGGTLAARLGKPLPIGACIDIARPVASALDYAHSRGMVHRDVKPSNILMTADGTPILSDFGLARMMAKGEALTRLTMSGATLGTPEYMAPEQVINSDVGPPADIYALAVVLYEMLTGSVPYSSDTQLAILMARVNDPVPLPRDRNPDLPETLQHALLKGLAKAPEDRYRTAGEMVRALEAASRPSAQAEPKPAASEPKITERAHVPAASTTRTPVLIAAVVALLVVTAVGLFIWSRRQPPVSSQQDAVAPPPAPVVTSATNSTPSAPEETTAGTRGNVPAAPTGANNATPPPAAPRTVNAAIAANATIAASDGLPPHGDLLFSLRGNLAQIAATPQRFPGNRFEVKGEALEITAASDQGAPSAAIPVKGVGDFVAVLRYAAVTRRPSLRFRFHDQQPQGDGVMVHLPASMRMGPPANGAAPVGTHTCCNTFDIFVSPQSPGKPAIFTGPSPMLISASAEEEQTAVISVKGSTITVYANGQEVARATDDTFATGGFTLALNTDGGQRPAVARLNALDIYDAPPSSPRPTGPPPRGKLLYSIDSNLSEIASSRQQGENTIAVTNGKLEFAARDSTGVYATLPLGGIGDFVAALQISAVSQRPQVNFRFHKAATAPGEDVVALPGYLRLKPPPASARPVGQHPCCSDFDVYLAPLFQGKPAIFTGPEVISAPTAPGEVLDYVISVKGPLIVVYADGQEIGRVSDSTFGPGGMLLQVLARGGQQFPAVLRLHKLEIYESSR
jgi:serine/threonine protein kinase